MKRIGKILFKLAIYLLALIGLITLAFLFFIGSQGYGLSVSYNAPNYAERIELLRTATPYTTDTTPIDMRFSIDSLRAAEIMAYFRLDTLYSANDNTWEKSLAIGKFVTRNIPHANQRVYPEQVHAIGLWEYTKNVEPAFNCRLHSIMTFELLSAAGIKARYITCLPKDENDQDCHVVNEVWLPEQCKWVMLDTDMGGHYVTDTAGNLLSLREMREHYIADKAMLFYPGYENGGSQITYYYEYMAKNVYWFARWENLGFFQEDFTAQPDSTVRGSYYALVPSGFEPFGRYDPKPTSDVEQFWK